MPLSSTRIHRGKPTPYAWEREALDHLYKPISDNDPHQAWELYELYEPGSGRIYEVDLVFLSRVGLIVVEVKSHPGVLRGDMVDWTFTDDTGHKRHIECPFASVNLKARVLGSMLERHMPGGRPWVHAAVFVSKATAVHLEGGTPPWLLQRDDAAKKLVNGFGDREPKVIVNKPLMKQVLQSAERIGLRPSQSARIVGGFTLGELIDDGEGYQEHFAKSSVVQSDQARVRSYLVPAATSTERRAQLQRAARREANALSQLGQHPGILSYRTFVEDAPLGPAVVFEAFEKGAPLHTFLKQHPELTFDERLNVLQQIVEAVAHCHRSGVVHRNLSPASVLVCRDTSGKCSVRLHRFQSAQWIEHSSFGTLHLNDLAHDLDRLYEAPEVLTDPKKASFESDIFSVGCLAWLLLTGQNPAATLADREQRIGRPEDSKPPGLRPSTVREELAALDDAFCLATHPNQHARADDIDDWFNGWLLDSVTRPAPDAAAERDPSEAQRDDELPGRLKVVRRLGKGGTALVLHVRREGRDFALKVPHDEGCGDRLSAEARVVKQLRHEHIVGIHETITIKKLPCLLLDYAGEQTLAELLRAQGTLPLELARRYGDDLLSAVQYLEEQGVTHRDIKPGNIGFTNVAKKMQHLLLLDFSLSAADPKSVSAGTAEWRDPWLYLRGAWDAAADRWSAAAVLYQVVTGARPQVADSGTRAGEVHVEAERFDAAVRDRLAAFFRKALAKAPSARFSSAETMRQAWVEALAPGGDDELPREPLDVSQVRPETPVDALPLSVRARNALDRAGVRTVADLLQLPRNQLSVIRGVGSKVARDIVAIADLLRASVTVEAGPPLVPGYVRPRLQLDDAELKLEAAVSEALAEAGLSSTVDVAQAPEARVRLLIGDAPTEALRTKLSALAAAEPAPGSLGDWVKELVGRAAETEANRRLRLLVGLDPFPDGRPDQGTPAARGVPEVAGSLGIELAQVHSSLQFLRAKRWHGHATVKALHETLSSLLDVHGPAVTLLELAATLAVARAGPGATDDDRRNAAALVRVALEVRSEPLAQWRRIGATAWIARDAAVLDAVAALGAAADRLAANESLPSSETVRTVLTEVVKDTPLADLPADRRVVLAARASERAAASARLELYPKGLDVVRQVKLSIGALTGDRLTPEVVRERVSGRYPEGAPLPERPALDALLAVHGLIFNTGTGAYARPGENVPTSQTVLEPKRPTSVPPPLVIRSSPDEQRADAFQSQLRDGVRSGRFRVVQVRADLTARATEALSRELGTPALSFDHEFVEALRAKAKELEVEWQNVEEADRAGPSGPNWDRLGELVRRAADDLVAKLLTPRDGPVLLTWPGAFERYGLAGALSRLAEQAEHGRDTPGVLLIVPSFLDGLPPTINGRLPVPAPLPQQRLVMPDAWFARHKPREAS